VIEQMLTYNADERLTAARCLDLPYFKEIRDADKKNNPPQTHNAFNLAPGISNIATIAAKSMYSEKSKGGATSHRNSDHGSDNDGNMKGKAS
jgi:hypothetical protein